jgi:fructokinase
MEGGGTKFICAVGTGPDDILAEIRIPTTTPRETLAKAILFFKKQKVDALGLAPFGPLDLDPSSPSYGVITSTPKPGWGKTNILSVFQNVINIPIALDTDVNAAAFGEYYWTRPDAPSSLVYFTIGTGIGAGIVIQGKIIHGLTHPEAGHMRLPHDRIQDPFPGICPFHGDCFEGLASGPALAARWGVPAGSLPDEHPGWQLEARYIALALANLIYTVSPMRIILGGGVMQRSHLFPIIREEVNRLLNNYPPLPGTFGWLDRLIVPPGLGTRSGILGSMALARSLLAG